MFLDYEARDKSTKQYKYSDFFPSFSDVDNSLNIVHRLLKLSVLILDILTKETMSQISYLRLSSYSM